MAEYGAHISASLIDRPSIFEIIAQESLANTIPPALKRVVNFLAATNPDKFGWLYRRYDEIYLILNSILQYHYLNHYGASFSETFYGLQRVPIINTNNVSVSTKLSIKHKIMSIAFLTVFPYIKKKIESLATNYRLQEVDGLLQENKSENKAKKFFCKTYTVAHLAWESIVLAQYLRYMSGHSKYHSPLLKAASLTLQHSLEEAVHWGDVWSWIRKGDFSLPESPLKVAAGVLIRTMELGAFFIQFLQWWHAERVQVDLTALPIPGAPTKNANENVYKGKCPLCLQRWKIPTALSVSGYVFCFRCIVRHLKETSQCPVTKYPATTEDLIRIYDE